MRVAIASSVLADPALLGPHERKSDILSSAHGEMIPSSQPVVKSEAIVGFSGGLPLFAPRFQKHRHGSVLADFR
jgi:hypothetical protein